MLEIRPNCEHCNKELLYNSTEAMICSFECTYCRTCALEVFENVCPNCNGNFTSRPIRPKKAIKKYPASTAYIYKPKDLTKLNTDAFKNIKPEDR